MTKTSHEVEKEFMDGLKKSTGKTLDEWIAAINDCGIKKRNDIIDWLKGKNNFGHMHASLLAGIYFNKGIPVYRNILLEKVNKRENS